MGSSASSKTTYTKHIRFAPYVEDRHSTFLTETFAQGDVMIDNSPFANFDTLDVNDAFFSTGYAISSFPSLYDMFGKFMAGLDIDAIWDNVFKDALENTEINEAVAKEMALVDDKITNDLVSFQLKMRDMNAIASSSFVVGKALIEDVRLKALANISSESKLGLIPNIQSKFIEVLNWNKKTTTHYAEFMKAYYQFKPDVDDYSTTKVSQNMLWPFTVSDFERAALASLLWPMSFQKKANKRKRSTLSRALFVAEKYITGASIGWAIGGPVGALIGAAIGFNVGLGMLFLEDDNKPAAMRFWLTGGMSAPWEFIYGDYANE